MATGSVEVIYRGIFQKTLAKNICRGIVFAARKEGKIGIAFGRSKRIIDGQLKRKPVREYLERQGRFAHFIDEDYEYFQSKIDEMWEKWLIPGVIPFFEAAG